LVPLHLKILFQKIKHVAPTRIKPIAHLNLVDEENINENT
jgi:hypothetical protein